MHFPVLLEEVIDNLALKPGCTVLDATAGGGGHASEILRRIAPGGRLIAVDRDPDAIDRTRRRIEGVGATGAEVMYVNDDFRNIDGILEKAGIKAVDAAVFDLGISSFQVDEAGKGFSFLKEGPLDMRFDPTRGVSAGDVVNGLGRQELAGMIRDYGEERHARKVAEAVCEARKKKRIETTTELAGIIRSAIGGWYSRQRLDPSVRTFQAIRIYVNDELGAAEEGVSKALRALKPGGRICVISFHSLEDRIVKNIFREAAKAGQVRIITKKPMVPTAGETAENPRSRSAKLRVAERTA